MGCRQGYFIRSFFIKVQKFGFGYAGGDRIASVRYMGTDVKDYDSRIKGEGIMKKTIIAIICVLTITGICLVTCNYAAPAEGTVETVETVM